MCQEILRVSEENFTSMNNGFVIFRSNYLKRIKEVIEKKLSTKTKIERIPYDEILPW
jgi:hypothetical protein